MDQIFLLRSGRASGRAGESSAWRHATPRECGERGRKSERLPCGSRGWGTKATEGSGRSGVPKFCSPLLLLRFVRFAFLARNVSPSPADALFVSVFVASDLHRAFGDPAEETCGPRAKDGQQDFPASRAASSHVSGGLRLSKRRSFLLLESSQANECEVRNLSHV